MAFGVLFALELFIKFVAFKWKALKDSWVRLDVVIVSVWIVTVAMDGFPFSSMVKPELVRLLRVGKLIRVARFCKFLPKTDSLILIMSAIRGSFSTLAWVVVVLLLTEMMFALVVSQVLEPFVTNQRREKDLREEVFMLFGTFMRSMLTMIGFVFGEWYDNTVFL